MVNSILMLIADLCGVGGMGFFLWAEIRQLWKILKTHKITGISKSAYKSKLAAVVLTSTMLVISALYMSFVVIITEGITIACIIYLLKKYKKQ